MSLRCLSLPEQLVGMEGGTEHTSHHVSPCTFLPLVPGTSPLPSWATCSPGLPHPLPGGHQGLLLPLQASHIVSNPIWPAATHPHGKTTPQAGSHGSLRYLGSCLCLPHPAHPLFQAFHLHILGRTLVASVSQSLCKINLACPPPSTCCFPAACYSIIIFICLQRARPFQTNTRKPLLPMISEPTLQAHAGIKALVGLNRGPEVSLPNRNSQS